MELSLKNGELPKNVQRKTLDREIPTEDERKTE